MEKLAKRIKIIFYSTVYLCDIILNLSIIIPLSYIKNASRSLNKNKGQTRAEYSSRGKLTVFTHRVQNMAELGLKSLYGICNGLSRYLKNLRIITSGEFKKFTVKVIIKKEQIYNPVRIITIAAPKLSSSSEDGSIQNQSSDDGAVQDTVSVESLTTTEHSLQHTLHTVSNPSHETISKTMTTSYTQLKNRKFN